MEERNYFTSPLTLVNVVWKFFSFKWRFSISNPRIDIRLEDKASPLQRGNQFRSFSFSHERYTFNYIHILELRFTTGKEECF